MEPACGARQGIAIAQTVNSIDARRGRRLRARNGPPPLHEDCSGVCAARRDGQVAAQLPAAGQHRQEKGGESTAQVRRQGVGFRAEADVGGHLSRRQVPELEHGLHDHAGNLQGLLAAREEASGRGGSESGAVRQASLGVARHGDRGTETLYPRTLVPFRHPSGEFSIGSGSVRSVLGQHSSTRQKRVLRVPIPKRTTPLPVNSCTIFESGTIPPRAQNSRWLPIAAYVFTTTWPDAALIQSSSVGSHSAMPRSSCPRALERDHRGEVGSKLSGPAKGA